MLALFAVSSLSLITPAQTQTPGNPGSPGGTPTISIEAWVDPIGGSDTSTPADQVNDPDQPFKTLAAAIDEVHLAIVEFYTPPAGQNVEDIYVEGTVYALPGVYGPITTVTPNASGVRVRRSHAAAGLTH